MAGPKAFIFDMDGVLVNTLEFHSLAWKKVAEVGHVPFNHEMIDHFRGLHRRECLRLLFCDIELSEQQVAAYFAVKDGQFDKSLRTMSANDILPGVKVLLEEAKAAGLKLGVASSSMYAKPVLKKTDLSPYFDAIADAYTVAKGKPEPDIFLWVARSLGVEPGEAVVFEDAAAGVAAAYKVDMFVIGLGDAAVVGDADLVLPTLEGVHLQDIMTLIQDNNREQ